jgi:hypothetical protein
LATSSPDPLPMTIRSKFSSCKLMNNNKFIIYTSLRLYKQTVGFGYRKSGIATTPIVQAPTFVCGLDILHILSMLANSSLSLLISITYIAGSI